MDHLVFSMIATIKKTVIHYPQFDKAYAQIERCIQLNKQEGIAQHMVCLGESGTGKSTLKTEIAKSYPAYEADDRLVIPVLVIDTPAIPSAKNIAEVMLIKMGDPCADRGSTVTKTSRIFNYLDKCSVKLIIFDELQHFIDRGKPSGTLTISDWLKTLIDQANIPTVLMGLERSEQILQVNEQLRRRFNHRIELTPFSKDNHEDAESFASVITKLDELFDLPNRIVLSSNLLERIHYATNGIIDYMVKLMLGAYEIALLKCYQGIDIRCLELSFTKFIWSQGEGVLNPFHIKFNWQHLDEFGMPFHRHIATTPTPDWK